MLTNEQSKQRLRGAYSLMRKPAFYEALQNILGQKSAWRRYISEFVIPKAGMRILDMGCGPGTVVEYLPEETEYVGFDIEPNCIQNAQANYGDRGKFFCNRVSDALIEETAHYDIVMANSILHHLDDNEGRVLFQTAQRSVADRGSVIVFDPVFVEGQNAIARFLISKDRGMFVRTPEQYLRLAKEFFPRVESAVVSDYYRIPYTIFIMKCYKA